MWWRIWIAQKILFSGFTRTNRVAGTQYRFETISSFVICRNSSKSSPRNKAHGLVGVSWFFHSSIIEIYSFLWDGLGNSRRSIKIKKTHKIKFLTFRVKVIYSSYIHTKRDPKSASALGALFIFLVVFDEWTSIGEIVIVFWSKLLIERGGEFFIREEYF